MDKKRQRFLKLIDHALQIGEEMGMARQWDQFDVLSQERLTRIVGLLQQTRKKALEGDLPPSEGTLTLGLAREVADWIESLDSPLLKAVGAVEGYYQQQL